jgi:diacylglycerol kinase family enzyme
MVATMPCPICILNGKSIHLHAALASIARVSSEVGVEMQVVMTKRGDDIASFAARATAEKRRLIVAGGGDGTINAVASQLVATDTPLGVLPMGTLNHFAKDVAISVCG